MALGEQRLGKSGVEHGRRVVERAVLGGVIACMPMGFVVDYGDGGHRGSVE